MFGVGGALAACPPGQLPRGPNGACMCNNGTGPGPGGNGVHCAGLPVRPDAAPVAVGTISRLLRGRYDAARQHLPGAAVRALPDTVAQQHLLLDPGSRRRPKAAITPPWTITQVLNLIWYGIYTPPPNFCCPSNQKPASHYPRAPGPGLTTERQHRYVHALLLPGRRGAADRRKLPAAAAISSIRLCRRAPYNPRTGSCCPSGTSALSNSYQCCPQGTFARADGPILASARSPSQELNSGNITCKRYCDADSQEVPIWNVATGGAVGCRQCPSGEVGDSAGRLLRAAKHDHQRHVLSVRYASGQRRLRTPTTSGRARGERRLPPRRLPPRRLPPHRPAADGLVPREGICSAVPVCVSRDSTHEQTIADNTSAPTRTKPDGNCIRGFVWRRGRPE